MAKLCDAENVKNIRLAARKELARLLKEQRNGIEIDPATGDNISSTISTLKSIAIGDFFDKTSLGAELSQLDGDLLAAFKGKQLVYYNGSKQPRSMTINSITYNLSDDTVTVNDVDTFHVGFSNSIPRKRGTHLRHTIELPGFGPTVRDIVDSYGLQNSKLKVKDTFENVPTYSQGSDYTSAEGTSIEVLNINEDTTLFDAYKKLYNMEEPKPMTEEFGHFTDSILNTFQNIIETTDIKNINVELLAKDIGETTGRIDTLTGNIRISWNKFSSLATLPEILVHETAHRLVHRAIVADPSLRDKLKDLRDIIGKYADYTLFLTRVPNPTEEQVVKAKKKFEYVFDPSADAEEFFAYAVSNEYVFNVLNQMPANVIAAELKKFKKYNTTNSDGSVNKLGELGNVMIEIINMQYQIHTGRTGTGMEMFRDIFTSVVKHTAEIERQDTNKAIENNDPNMLKKIKTKQDVLNAYIEEKIVFAENTFEEWKAQNSKLNKYMQMFTKLKYINKAMESGIIQGLANMIITDTSGKWWEYYSTHRAMKNEVEKRTVGQKRSVKEDLGKLFAGVDEATKSAVMKVIVQADVAAIDTNLGVLEKYLLDDYYTVQKIKDITEEIEGMTKRSDYVLSQAEGLGQFITTGKSTTHNQMINANNIIDTAKIAQSDDKKFNKLVMLTDTLASLHALQHIPMEQRQKVQKLFNSPSGSKAISNLISMNKAYTEILRIDSQVDTHDPIMKGYIKPGAGTIVYELVHEDDVASAYNNHMNFVGQEDKSTRVFKRFDKETISNYEPYIVIDGVSYYMMAGRQPTTGFDEGAIGLISNTLEGVSLSALVRKHNDMRLVKGLVPLSEEALLEKTRNTVHSMYLFQGTKTAKNKIGIDAKGHTLIPVMSHKNNVIDYRIPMDFATKLAELNEETNLEDVLSSTYSRSIKTTLTKENNIAVVDMILRNTAMDIAGNEDNYSLIEEYTPEMAELHVPRTKLHERWENLPESTKAYIKETTGTSAIMIHNNFVELMTGETELSIGQLRNGLLDLRKYPEARRRLVSIEGYIKEVLKSVKKVITLYVGDVVSGNVLSNMYVAGIHGIDPVSYVKQAKYYWNSLDQYTELQHQKNNLIVQGTRGEDVADRIAAIDQQMLANYTVIHLLAQDGQFNAIAEDIDTDDVSMGRLEETLQKAIDSSKVAPALNVAKNFLYINEDSALARFAVKNVAYQDTITRAIILQKILEEQATKKDINDIKELVIKHPELVQNKLNYTDQLLINYGYTMNRGLSYIEKVGGVMFMRYYLGQMKAIWAMTRAMSTRVIGGEGLQDASGIDLFDPMDTYDVNPIDALLRRWMLGDAVNEYMYPNIFDILPSLSLWK